MRAETAQPLRLGPLVVGVGEDIGEQDRAALEPHAPDERSTPERDVTRGERDSVFAASRRPRTRVDSDRARE